MLQWTGSGVATGTKLQFELTMPDEAQASCYRHCCIGDDAAKVTTAIDNAMAASTGDYSLLGGAMGDLKVMELRI
jgi:hypothetical protein